MKRGERKLPGEGAAVGACDNPAAHLSHTHSEGDF